MKKTHDQISKSVFVYSHDMARFELGPDHPFKPDRASKTYELCTRYGVMNYPWMQVLNPQPISPDLLTLFHEPEYLALLEEASQGKVRLEMLGRGLGTEDTPIVLGIYDWSLRAAGGTHQAMGLMTNGDIRVAFNPLGGLHHAMAGNAEGFCYINDVVIALMDALRHDPELRFAYVDLDAHHGNGVESAFYEDPRVLVVSIHETGRVLYPWSGFETETGAGRGKGFTVNVPLEEGADDEVHAFVFDAVVSPLISAFSPDIIVAELGADVLISDPLTHLKLTNNGFQRGVRGLMALCPKILALGGGGYDIYRTSRAWTLAWSILNQVEPVDEYAGLVGGMMFGPESEVGSLYDHPFLTKGEAKEKALREARRVVDYIRKEIFPIHGL